jgi:hypothetical protein
MRRTLYKNSKSVRAMTATGAKVTGAVNGDAVDRQQGGAGDYQSVMFNVLTGTATDGTHVVTMEDSPDGTTWTAVAAGFVQGTLPTLTSTDDDVVKDFGYVGNQRYVRIVLTSAGTTTGAIVGATAILYQTAGWKR